MNESVTAHETWAGAVDHAARTSPGRTGLLARFEREARERLGPDATEPQIADAAAAATKAHCLRLTAASAAARRAAGRRDDPLPR